jgi:hypothetical protein
MNEEDKFNEAFLYLTFVSEKDSVNLKVTALLGRQNTFSSKFFAEMVKSGDEHTKLHGMKKIKVDAANVSAPTE